MQYSAIFLSVVFVVRNRSDGIQKILTEAVSLVSKLVSDYELIVVDNASDDDSVTVYKQLTSEDGLPNIQVYALIKEVDSDTASWVGLENALGDYVAVIEPLLDDIEFLPKMLEKAMSGADVVFAKNKQKQKRTLAYQAAYAVFNSLYKWFNGINLEKEAPQYRVLSKSVINYILQHVQPAMAYRYLPASGSFPRANLTYSTKPTTRHVKRLGESIDRGVRLLVSTTRGPMRLVTTLSLFGALANLAYSLYVVIVWLAIANIEPGWVSLSLQQSGMFFLFSLVLLVLGEYILHMASLSNESPLYHIGREFTSARLTRKEKLNIEQAVNKSPPLSVDSPEPGPNANGGQ